MKKIWWSWDIRMRWYYGFSFFPESYIQNYTRAIDAAVEYGVDGIIIWGFLRDIHGGIDAAHKIVDHANAKGMRIIPGMGIDSYGGVYYEGQAEYCLDAFLRKHPEEQAVQADGTPFTFRHPKNDKTERLIGCGSSPVLMDFYIESVEWLLKEFDLGGIQLEQGDFGQCHCSRCKEGAGLNDGSEFSKVSHGKMVERIPPIIKHAASLQDDLYFIVETYHGFLPADIEYLKPYLEQLPDYVYHSYQTYTGKSPYDKYESIYKINDESRNPFPHGNSAIRTNSDFCAGEVDDREDIQNVIRLSKQAGLDMCYIYGEYPDTWPITRANYEAWSTAAEV